MADNYTRFGERLKQLVQEFVTDPLCVDHYELDVQWSVLQFLLDISKNPVAALTENKEKISTEDSIHGDDSLNAQQNSMMNDLLNSLMQNNISMGSDRSGRAMLATDESDLSVSL